MLLCLVLRLDFTVTRDGEMRRLDKRRYTRRHKALAVLQVPHTTRWLRCAASNRLLSKRLLSKRILSNRLIWPYRLTK